MKTKFAIKTPNGLVAGYSASNMCIQTAGTADWVKLFITRKAAEKFMHKYSDCGYGLNSKTAEVITMNKN